MIASLIRMCSAAVFLSAVAGLSFADPATAPLQPATAPVAIWPGFGGPTHDGVVATLPNSLEAMKKVWTSKMSGVCDAGLASDNGIVVVADHDDASDIYHCFDAATGVERWKQTFKNGREMEFGAGPRATPLIAGECVFVLSAFGELACLSTNTGKVVWELPLARTFNAEVPTWGYAGSPIMAGDRLIVPAGGKNCVAALEPQTGKILWRGEGEGINYASFTVGTLGGVEQVVGFDAGSLGGWELKTGRRLWTVEVDRGDGYIVPTPLIVNGKVFIADTGNRGMLFEFDSSGVVRTEPLATSNDAKGEIVSPIRLNDSVLCTAGNVVRLDPGSKLKLIWKFRDRERIEGECHAITDGNRILLLDEAGNGTLLEAGATEAKLIDSRQLCEKTRAHPAILGDMIFVRDADAVTAFREGSRGK